MDKTLDRIAHKLEVVRGIVYQAALEAETLRDQGLAEDLHMLHSDITGRLLPAVRKGHSKRQLDGDRTYLYSGDDDHTAPARVALHEGPPGLLGI